MSWWLGLISTIVITAIVGTLIALWKEFIWNPWAHKDKNSN